MHCKKPYRTDDLLVCTSLVGNTQLLCGVPLPALGMPMISFAIVSLGLWAPSPSPAGLERVTG